MKDSPDCKDWGDRPGCLRDPDDRYEMRFDDIGMPPIRWCSHCGPEARATAAALRAALASRGPGFAEELDKAITAAEGPKN